MPPSRSALLDWPVSWKAHSLLDLIEDSPFGVLVFQREMAALAAEAARRGFQAVTAPEWQKQAEIGWSRPGPLIRIGDAAWPGLGSAAADSAEAGPTGLPWLESNGWLIRMARDLAQDAEVWIRSDPPEDANRIDASIFAFAQTEARAHGALRLLWVPPSIAEGLAAGNAHALSWWRKVCEAESAWETRAAWKNWPTAARLRVVSDFSGANQYPAFELLNLAARRNLPWRAVLGQNLDEAALRGAAAVVYIDQAPLEDPLQQRLERFVREGGLLVCLEEAAGALRGAQPTGAEHPRMRILRFGKGRLAVSRSGWDDPYLLAQDVHLLMSRRRDVVRLFNPGSLLCWPVISPDRRRLLVHLLNYSRHGAAHDVIVQTWTPVASAVIGQPGAGRRAAAVKREAGGWEIPLEPFDSYCAVELEGNWDGAG
jgi:hypothetical protein